MSKRSRLQRARAAHLSAPAQPQQIASPSTWAGSGYDGANWSSRRGYVYFPTLDTRQEIPRWTRLEMLRRARYLTRNIGYAKRCTTGLATMVGSLKPHATTSDREWNQQAEDAWERRAERPLTFDRSGRFGVSAWQQIMTSARLTDGDFLSVLTESQTGGAMVAGYEGHQVGNALVDSVQLEWRDGIHMVNDRAVGCRIIDPMDPTIFVDVPSSDYILHANYLSIGHSRGVTSLHHAINNMLDITEIRSDVKLGIKLGNRIGYYIAKDALTNIPGGPRGMGGPVKADKTETGEPILMENVYRGGKIMTLNPGEQIKQLLDQRPHPNSREFLEDLNRDIAWGSGVSPDVLWNIAKLGGAGARYVIADAQVWIESQQQLLVDQFLHRFWVYFISKEIKCGRLRPPQDPEWWWNVAWQPPAKLTVDIGRDGRLSIDLHRAGMLTLQRWYGSQGLDHEYELKQYVREYALRIKLCEDVGKEFGLKLDPNLVFPPAPGAAAPGNIVTPDDAAFSQQETVQRIADIHEFVRHQQVQAA